MISAMALWLLLIASLPVALWLFESRRKTRAADDSEQASGSGSAWSWASALRFGGILALARLFAFWYLLHRQWAGRESIELIALVLGLYPEALLVPARHPWTIPSALLFSALLIVGSMAMASLALALVNLVRRAICR